MVCTKCSNVSADKDKFCGACGAPLDTPPAKPMSRFEKIKLAGKVAYVAAVVGTAAAASMSGPYIPAAALGDETPLKKPEDKREPSQQ